MKNSRFVIIFIFLGCLALCSSKKYNSHNAFAKQQRKPFASPEKISLFQDYKRIKRTPAKSVAEFQDFLMDAKAECAKSMGFENYEIQKSFLYEENPTPKEKCLMMCILKRAEIMDDENKLSTSSIGHLADILSQNNALVISIAMATADRCNRKLNTPEPCEAAYQINKCIANEMKARKIKLYY